MDAITSLLRRPILFLKSIKNQAGYALYGNPPRWHKVNPDKPAPHDAHHVALSHYHVAAVKKLHADPAFHALDPHEQVHKVKGLAAELQSAASLSAAVSMWKKAALAGQNPTPGQWKAFFSLPSDKRDQLMAEVQAAVGGLGHLNAPSADAPAEQATQAKPAPDVPPATAPAPEPKKPASPNPWPNEVWAQHYLPPSNSNAPSHNKKIDALKNAADAGDVAAIEAMKFGSNTYGKKQAKIAADLLAAMKGAKPAPKVVSVKPAGQDAQAKLAEMAAQVAAKKKQITDAVHAAGYGVAENAAHGMLLAEHKNGHPMMFADKDKAESLALHAQAAGISVSVVGSGPYLLRVDGILSGGNGAAAPSKAATPVEVPHFDSYQDALIWAKQRATDLGMTWTGYVSSPEYKEHVYPVLVGLYHTHKEISAEAAKKHGAEMQAKMAEVGVKPGDKVSWTQVGALMTTESHSGVVKLNQSGVPMVHLDYEIAVSKPGGKIGYVKKIPWKPYMLPEPEPELAHSFFNQDAGMAAMVHKHADGKWGVTVKNTQAGDAQPVVNFYSTEEQAVASAKEAVGLTSRAPKVVSVRAKTQAEPAKAADDGPKEGDIKQGADGMLVFHEGHWHKVESGGSPISIDGWKQVGGQKGSNPGGVFAAPDGTQYYCKFPDDPDHARSEVLAAKLYALAGVDVPSTRLISRDGKIGIASPMDPELKHDAAALASGQVHGVKAGFAADAWLANYDVAGQVHDNVMLKPDGKPVRIDVGASLAYRARGKKKPFTPTVNETKTLLDPNINPQASAMFAGITEADITAGVAKIAAIDDEALRAAVMMYGPGSEANRKKLIDTLLARRADLLAQYPQAAKFAEKEKKKRLDPTKLPVDPEKLPKAHDFLNWHGPGKGLSSKDHINQANTAIEQEMLAIAKQGNLPALMGLKFEQIDKETGKKTGKLLPISEHPSKHVVQLHQDLAQHLDEIANPPRPLKLFHAQEISTIEALDAAFPPNPFGTTVNSVNSNQKLGFWVALGAVSSVEHLKPKKTQHLTKAAIDAAYDRYKEAPPLAKHFIDSVQASGSYNELFRQGKKEDHSGHSLAEVAKAALDYSTEHPEGTTIYRWQNMTDSMVQKILSAPDGTVFQATGPMCASYSPTATKSFGKHRVVIRYAKGARGVESFGSGNYKSEKEVTTLPNARFVILSKQMVNDDLKYGERLELEVLMLPPDLGLPK